MIEDKNIKDCEKLLTKEQKWEMNYKFIQKMKDESKESFKGREISLISGINYKQCLSLKYKSQEFFLTVQHIDRNQLGKRAMKKENKK